MRHFFAQRWTTTFPDETDVFEQPVSQSRYESGENNLLPFV